MPKSSSGFSRFRVGLVISFFGVLLAVGAKGWAGIGDSECQPQLDQAANSPEARLAVPRWDEGIESLVPGSERHKSASDENDFKGPRTLLSSGMSVGSGGTSLFQGMV